jgi:YidC/Oxa1 family membrane protein insertase
MNEEVAALYRSEKVNPAGGCLPMLLQFPVLIGFYSLLSHAIELRGAPWVWWIEDLSMHDPIYLLPIVMGAVQFLQQKMAPSSGDAMQRKLMMAMPVVFTFLFMGFPSGLVLYWLTNNVLTLVQQLVYQRIKARQAADPGVAA